MMSRRTKGALVILALGLAAMVIVPHRDPIPTPAESLHAVAIHGDEHAVELALRQGAAVDARDNIGMVPLIEAARAGHLQICQKLLDAGADVNAMMPVYGTPLMQAAFYGHDDVVHLLLLNGANPYLHTESGMDVVKYAILGGNRALAAGLRTRINSPDCR